MDDQYMIGDRMMVAPLFAGEAGRKVVFPQGHWHDFWTGETMSGGTEISVPSSRERIPVYVKSGSIVPWADVGLHAGAPETRRITARVYGDGGVPFVLFGHKGNLRLSWRDKHGVVEGKGSGYEVYAWNVIG